MGRVVAAEMKKISTKDALFATIRAGPSSGSLSLWKIRNLYKVQSRSFISIRRRNWDMKVKVTAASRRVNIATRVVAVCSGIL